MAEKSKVIYVDIWQAVTLMIIIIKSSKCFGDNCVSGLHVIGLIFV